MLMAFDGGSTFDADYPRKWVNIECRLTIFYGNALADACLRVNEMIIRGTT